MRTALIARGLVWLLLAAPMAGQDPRPTITVGTATAKRGERVYGELVVPPGIDSGYSIQVAVIHGAKPGKVVAFISGSHGTEYTSIVAMTRLIDKIDPAKLSGTVIVVPLLNNASFEQMIVHTNPVDRRGMNAGYPGMKDGSQSLRAVGLVAEQVVAPADVIVDLHGGDIDEDLRPYTYWSRNGDPVKDSAMSKLIHNFGIDHVIVRNVDASRPGASLDGYAQGTGKLSIVAEAGRSGQVLPVDLDLLINGSLNVLGTLGMIDRPVKPMKVTYITAGTRVAADKAEMWYPLVARDTRVKEGQVLGYMTDYVGRKIGEVKSPADGLVSFIRTVPSAPARATLVNVAAILPEAGPYVKPAPRGGGAGGAGGAGGRGGRGGG